MISHDHACPTCRACRRRRHDDLLFAGVLVLVLCCLVSALWSVS